MTSNRTTVPIDDYENNKNILTASLNAYRTKTSNISTYMKFLRVNAHYHYETLIKSASSNIELKSFNDSESESEPEKTWFKRKKQKKEISGGKSSLFIQFKIPLTPTKDIEPSGVSVKVREKYKKI